MKSRTSNPHPALHQIWRLFWKPLLTTVQFLSKVSGADVGQVVFIQTSHCLSASPTPHGAGTTSVVIQAPYKLCWTWGTLLGEVSDFCAQRTNNRGGKTKPPGKDDYQHKVRNDWRVGAIQVQIQRLPSASVVGGCFTASWEIMAQLSMRTSDLDRK